MGDVSEGNLQRWNSEIHVKRPIELWVGIRKECPKDEHCGYLRNLSPQLLYQTSRLPLSRANIIASEWYVSPALPKYYKQTVKEM